MTDRFDEAKRSLEGVPANDVWAEAERRATDGSVVPLVPVPAGRRHRGRWLAAAAAVAVLVVGTVAVLASDDGAPVDTVPGTDGAAPEPAGVTTYQADGGCKVGIRGEPLPEPVTTAFASPNGTAGTMLVGHLNGVQQYAVHVPGQAVIDLVGERVEDVQLQRGTAQIWFQGVPNDSVQVRWFTGGQDDCESFTVSVESGTEDENRHAAVDLAERVLVGPELEAATQPHPTPQTNRLANTEWQLERSTVDGEPTDGDGLVFNFTGATADWSDGCNKNGANYTYSDETLTLGAVGSTDVGCVPNPTTDAINAVMTEGPVAVTFDGDLMTLRNDDIELVLRQREATARPGTDPTNDVTTGDDPVSSSYDTAELVGTDWIVTALEDGGESVPLHDTAVPVGFQADGISWLDDCNTAGTPVTYGEGTIVITGHTFETEMGCPSPVGPDVVVMRAVLSSLADDGSAETISVDRTGDRLTLKRGDKVIVLSPA